MPKIIMCNVDRKNSDEKKKRLSDQIWSQKNHSLTAKKFFE